MRQMARGAGLHYASDRSPGVSRRRRGRSFIYIGLRGTPIRDARELKRIRSLAVPPAYERVWINPDPNGHIQATGYDQRGRKQYRYHAKWRTHRDGDKFLHVLDFAKALPAIRRRTRTDLHSSGLSRVKVLACIVQLLDRTHIRVGNEEYARTNKSYGLSTLQNRHAKVTGDRIRFEFKGKSGILHKVDVANRRLARVVHQCWHLPGKDLFQYVDDAGKRHPISSTDVNRYLEEMTGDHFTAKDFRTWAGTVYAAVELAKVGKHKSEADGKRRIVAAITAVSQRLRNTPAVCRKSYIHPQIIESYLSGSTIRSSAGKRSGTGLSADERAVIALLKSVKASR